MGDEHDPQNDGDRGQPQDPDAIDFDALNQLRILIRQSLDQPG